MVKKSIPRPVYSTAFAADVCRAAAAGASADEIAQKSAPMIVATLVNKALGGDTNAARTVLDRVWPPRAPRFSIEALPKSLKCAQDGEAALAAILGAVAVGHVAPSEAAEVSSIIERWLRARELTIVEQRLAALEAGVSAINTIGV